MHFQSITSNPPLRRADLNWPELNFQHHDLASLVEPFTEEELHKIVKHMTSDKAPSRMDSQESSLKVVGRSLRGIFCVVQRFYDHRTNSPALLNSANVVLIPKKEGAESIGDYRAISLIRGIAKLISKLLAARLQPYMNAIVSTN